MIVVDDRLLLDVVVGSATPVVEPFLRVLERRELFTTGYWYWRLARAIAHPTGGSLSGPFAAMTEDDQRKVLGAMASLPDSIGILNLRRLVPVMAALPGQLNILTAEAVATAIVLDASVAVVATSAMLDRAQQQPGCRSRWSACIDSPSSPYTNGRSPPAEPQQGRFRSVNSSGPVQVCGGERRLSDPSRGGVNPTVW